MESLESLPFLLPKVTPLAHSSDWCAEKGFGLHRGIQEIDFLSVRQPWKSQSEGSMQGSMLVHAALDYTSGGSQVEICNNADLFPEVWVWWPSIHLSLHLLHESGDLTSLAPPCRAGTLCEKGLSQKCLISETHAGTAGMTCLTARATGRQTLAVI